MQELRIKATSNEALHGIGVMLTPPRELVRSTRNLRFLNIVLGNELCTLPTFYEMVNHDWAAFFTETAELISPLKKLLHLSYKK